MGVPQQLRDAVNRNRGEALLARRDDGDQIPVEVEQPAARHLAGPGDVCKDLVDRPRPAAHGRRPEVVRRREAGLPVAPPQRDGPLAARPLPGHAAAGRRQPGDRRDAQRGNRQVQTGCRHRDAHVAGGRSDGRGIREAGLGTARQDEVRLPDDAAPVEARQAHDVRFEAAGNRGEVFRHAVDRPPLRQAGQTAELRLRRSGQGIVERLLARPQQAADDENAGGHGREGDDVAAVGVVHGQMSRGRVAW